MAGTKQTYTYDYPHSAVAADVLVFAIKEDALQTLLIKRGETPYNGRWAIPGGFLRMDETIEQCARRELVEETGLATATIFNFGIFSNPKRDPRERVLSIAYFALARHASDELQAGTDASDARWFPLSSLPSLAFDHAQIADRGLAAMRGRAENEPLAPLVLGDSFTMTELQQAAELLADKTFERRNFRRLKIEAGWVEATGDQRTGNHPPADLYRLTRSWKEKYDVR